jgi:hypothetical protein
VEIAKMNSPKRIRLIYQLLKVDAGDQYKDSEILEFANSIYDIFLSEDDSGYEYKSYYEDKDIKDSYSLLSSGSWDLIEQERDLINDVYEFESDDFIINKPWKNNYFGGEYEY